MPLKLLAMLQLVLRTLLAMPLLLLAMPPKLLLTPLLPLPQAPLLLPSN